MRCFPKTAVPPATDSTRLSSAHPDSADLRIDAAEVPSGAVDVNGLVSGAVVSRLSTPISAQAVEYFTRDQGASSLAQDRETEFYGLVHLQASEDDPTRVVSCVSL